MIDQLGLIGCGLMGGSFALALRRAGLVRHVVGYSKSSASAQRARTLGIIDADVPSAALAAQGSDVVFIAVPVAATQGTFEAIQHCVSPNMLLMDVGSTKTDVLVAGQRGLGDRVGTFVPAHAMAGKEVSGIEHADANLYQGRQVILTPSAQTQEAQRVKAHAIWTALGCRVLHMSAQQHDASMAAISHLPHLLAFAAVNAIAAQPQSGDYLAVAGPGFRDFSRIAASDPTVWRDIFRANRNEVLTQLAHFRESLAQLETALHATDATELTLLLEQASAVRSHWTSG